MKNEQIANEIEDQEFKWGEKRELTDVERMEYQVTPDILTEAHEIQRNEIGRASCRERV